MSPQGRRGAMAGGLWLAVSNVLALGSTLVLSVVMGRVLGAADLGEQSYISFAAALMSAILVGTVTTTGIRNLSHAHGRNADDQYRQLLQWTAIGHVGGSAIVAIVLVMMSSWSEYWVSWLLAALTVLLDGFFWLLAAPMVSTGGWGSVARARLVSQVSASAMGIGFVLTGLGIAGVFLGNAIASAALAVWAARSAGLPPGRPLARFPRYLLPLWGTFLALTVINEIVTKRIEFLFLEALSTTVELAMYSVAFMAVSTAAMLISSVIGGAGPALAAQAGAGRVSEVTDSLGTAIRIVAIASTVVTAGVAALGPCLVSLAYGSEFLPAAELVPLSSLGILPGSVAALGWAFAIGLGSNRIPIIAGSIAAVVDIGIAVALIGSLGALGAVFANLGGQAVLMLGIVLLLRRQFPRLRIGALKLVAPVAAGAVIAAATAATVAVRGYGDAVSASVSLLAGGAVFAVLAAGYGATAGFVRGADGAWLADSLPPALHRFLPLVTGRGSR